MSIIQTTQSSTNHNNDLFTQQSGHPTLHMNTELLRVCEVVIDIKYCQNLVSGLEMLRVQNISPIILAYKTAGPMIQKDN